MKVYIQIIGNDYEGDIIQEVYLDKELAERKLYEEIEQLNSDCKKDFPNHKDILYKPDSDISRNEIVKYRCGSGYYTITEWDTIDAPFSPTLDKTLYL